MRPPCVRRPRTRSTTSSPARSAPRRAGRARPDHLLCSICRGVGRPRAAPCATRLLCRECLSAWRRPPRTPPPRRTPRARIGIDPDRDPGDVDIACPCALAQRVLPVVPATAVAAQVARAATCGACGGPCVCRLSSSTAASARRAAKRSGARAPSARGAGPGTSGARWNEALNEALLPVAESRAVVPRGRTSTARRSRVRCASRREWRRRTTIRGATWTRSRCSDTWRRITTTTTTREKTTTTTTRLPSAKRAKAGA